MNVLALFDGISYINRLFEVEPILINSALVSTQNRKRLYWTNIDRVNQPEDLYITWSGLEAWSRSTRYPEETGGGGGLC